MALYMDVYMPFAENSVYFGSIPPHVNMCTVHESETPKSYDI